MGKFKVETTDIHLSFTDSFKNTGQDLEKVSRNFLKLQSGHIRPGLSQLNKQLFLAFFSDTKIGGIAL